jgi:uncharacterized protein
MATINLKPVELIVLQSNSLCNLNCSYCDLSASSRRTNSVMPLELLEKLFAELFSSGNLAPEVAIVWHSGEPLTLPPSYYDEAIRLILDIRDKVAGNAISVRFKIQTNGVLINDDWCAFFKRHQARLDLGVSCDGPAELHDSFRLNWNGHATHAKVIRGIELLQANKIKYKIIAVVTRKTLSQPEAFYKFFFDRRRSLSGFHFNVLADANSDDSSLSYSAGDRKAYYSFFRRLLELVHEANAAGAEFEIQNFSEGLARIMAVHTAGASNYFEDSTAPLKSLSVDALGNITTFYAGLGIEVLRNAYGDGKGLSIGNILELSFDKMVKSAKLQRIIGDFEISAQSCRSGCEYFSVCPGGYEITKRQRYGTFDASETTECVIHVKALVDALLDDINDHLHQRPAAAAAIL